MNRLALAMLCLTACSQRLPGEVVGTYLITMKLEENTCGPSAVFLSDGKTYSAQVRVDGMQGYWRLADGKPLPGKYTDQDEFTFSFSSIVASSDPDAGGPVCQLVQNELLTGKIHRAVDENADDATDAGQAADASVEQPGPGVLDGGVSSDSKTTLTGRHELNIAAAEGTDCQQALHPRGPFVALPCKVTYRLTGKQREDF